METKSSTKYIAEFIGTFFLVLIGCGAAVISGATADGIAPSGIGLLGISLAFGLSVVVMAYTIGPISGCHINPAISIAMAAAGQLSVKDTIAYVVSQILGAIAASGVLYLILSGKPGFEMGEYALGSNGWGAEYLGKYSTTAAFITEAVLTFLFLIVIFGTTAKRANPSMAGLAIGLTLLVINLAAIPVSGASVNPARSIGPAIFAGGLALKQLWLFIVAPIVGGLVAATFWKVVMPGDDVITKKTVDVHEDISINRL
jgi:aquaporin Z